MAGVTICSDFGAHYCFLTAPLLSLHSLCSLISKCLNLPVGTQVTHKGLMKPISCNQETGFGGERCGGGGHRKTVVPWSSQGSALHQQIYDNWEYLVVYMAALTKNHKLRGLNNRHGLSQGSEGQKFKIKSSAGMVLSEAGRENLVQTSL